MPFVGAGRAIAAGILLVAVSACGGGGGARDNGANPAPVNDASLSVPLPNIEQATEKTLTRDNARQALDLAMSLVTFVDSNALPYPLASEFHGDISRKATRLPQKMQASGPSRAAVDVSADVCISGTATAEQIEPEKIVVRFIKCDVGDAIFDGVATDENVDPSSASVASHEIITLQGLHSTTPNQDSDVVFDGKFEILISDINFGDVGEMGMVLASLDVRDLLEKKGYSLRDYNSGFKLVAAEQGGLAIGAISHRGTIYDEQGEYFSLATIDPGSDAALFLSSNISEYAPLQQAIRYMMNTYPEKVSLSLKGLHSDLYVFDDAFSNSARLQLVLPPDTCGAVNSTGGGFGFTFPHAFPFTPACYLRVDMGDPTPAAANDFAPVINLADINTTVTAGQYFVIPHLDVKDVDQQFASISWELVSTPAGVSPLYFSWNDGFLFSASIAGTYEFRVTAADGIHTAEQLLTITVNY